ncbi:protein of unknown function [Candidatus Promineifilum breve]|uniref:Uncharacterized protein n=1 Tax=Candidatus Promineifilum breve TaxID=1806508 RepID=A0A160T3G4_9CHLR|nr:hypothetical protein [Candidatus Promineifilum breve]CUS03080.2 protein of unknown function [Candidatus Promineifilum breve]
MQVNTLWDKDEIRERVSLLQLQINWLQQEMIALRRVLEAETVADQPPRTFASLFGAWAETEISDQDIEDARIKLPESLR